jgi:hypothetical protein
LCGAACSLGEHTNRGIDHPHIYPIQTIVPIGSLRAIFWDSSEGPTHMHAIPAQHANKAAMQSYLQHSRHMPTHARKAIEPRRGTASMQATPPMMKSIEVNPTHHSPFSVGISGSQCVVAVRRCGGAPTRRMHVRQLAAMGNARACTSSLGIRH